MDYPFTPLIRSLPETVPFVGPEAIERRIGRPFGVRIGANESAFGISPLAREAMEAAIDQVHWYNDPENFELRQALSVIHRVGSDEIVVGGGIDDLLGLAVRAFLSPGEVTVASLGSYPTYHYHVLGFGARCETVPYLDDQNDLDGLSAAVLRTGSRLVYLSNPDNPSSTWHSAAELQAFFSQIPETTVIILDEAYVEFAPDDAVPALTPMDPRLTRMRTFSKAHGMAGARVGYAVCAQEIASAFQKIRLHFMVNRMAQAGALASLGEPSFVRGVVQEVAIGRREYVAAGRAVELRALPSATNFVTFDAHTPKRAQSILDRLEHRGVFVRKPSAPPLDRCFRATVGKPEERRVFARVLAEVVAELPDN